MKKGCFALHEAVRSPTWVEIRKFPFSPDFGAAAAPKSGEYYQE